MSTRVLVFTEQRDGRLRKAGLEALCEGRRLADATGGSVVALVAGHGIASLAVECGKYGADEVLLADQPELAVFSSEAYRDVMAQAVATTTPQIVLLPATAMGLDVAARTAARLRIGCLTDVVSLHWRDGALEAVRPVYAGKALATATLSTSPAMATLRPNVFALREVAGTGSVSRLEVTVGPVRARVVRVEGAEQTELDVAEADVVVSGGRGLREPHNFAVIASLAKVLGGAVGASRAAVDAGWIGHSHQIGQTGKTVAPKLYIAAGISGAIQHLAGMSSSKVIVAINKDQEAPIFKHATYGIVGDLFEVVPALVAEIEAYQAKHA